MTMKRWIPTWPSFCTSALRLDAHKLEWSRRVRAEGQKQKYNLEWPDGKLPFLDTLLQHKNNGSLKVSIHRYPTHTNRFLSFSHCPHHVKEGMVSCSFPICIHLPQTVDAGERQRLTGDKSGVVYHVPCSCASIYMGRDRESS